MVKLKLNERIRELEAEVKQFKEKQEEPDPEVTRYKAVRHVTNEI